MPLDFPFFETNRFRKRCDVGCLLLTSVLYVLVFDNICQYNGPRARDLGQWGPGPGTKGRPLWDALLDPLWDAFGCLEEAFGV